MIPMIPMISVKIPSHEDLVEYSFVYSSKTSPIAEDKSLWGSAVYEIWDSQRIYNDLYFSIKQYVTEIDCALFYSDFSEKTRKEFELTKKIIIEGVHLCRQEKNDLFEPLHQMLTILKKYIDAIDMAKEVVRAVQTLSNKIVQLQVDIQVSMMDFYDNCYCQQCDDYADFYRERTSIRKEMERLEKNGANAKEMKRIRDLFQGLKLEFRQYKNLWNM